MRPHCYARPKTGEASNSARTRDSLIYCLESAVRPTLILRFSGCSLQDQLHAEKAMHTGQFLVSESVLGILTLLLALTSLSSALDNGLGARGPPMVLSPLRFSTLLFLFSTASCLLFQGWSSWNHFGAHVNADIIKQAADAMASNGMRAAGYEYINLDVPSSLTPPCA